MDTMCSLGPEEVTGPGALGSCGLVVRIRADSSTRIDSRGKLA